VLFRSAEDNVSRCDLGFSVLLSAGLVLTIAGPGGAQIDDRKPTVAAPEQPISEDFYRKRGVIRPPDGIDPNVSVPLFLAPVLWRDAAIAGRNPGGQLPAAWHYDRAPAAAEAA